MDPVYQMLVNFHEHYQGSDLRLLVDSCNDSGFFLDLNESATSNGRTRFRGKFQEANGINKNKRMYPFAILDENVKRLNEAIASGGLVGELDHPTDSIIHFTNASHKINRLWWDGNTLMGEGEILNTPHGKVLKALISDGVRVGISSRGVGNGKVNEEGILVIGESYKLITFDAVADPSTHQAFQKEISKKSETVSPSDNPSINATKNESSSIHKVSKEQLLACFGGILFSKTNELKARLNNGKDS